MKKYIKNDLFFKLFLYLIIIILLIIFISFIIIKIRNRINKKILNINDCKILCITRHSLRGTISFFNSQEIDLPNQINFPHPISAWNQDLEKEATKLIQIDSINQCVQLGLNTIGLSNFNNNWDEIRCDFLAKRTFETGRILQDKIKNKKPKLTVVIDKQKPKELYEFNKKNIDAVTKDIEPGDFPQQPPSKPTSINPEILHTLTINFLNYLNLALKNKNLTGKLPPVIVNGEITSFYKNNISITMDKIIMSAIEIPPFNKIYKTMKKFKYQKELLKSACLWKQYFFSYIHPLQYSIYQSIPVMQYLNKMNYGDNRILITHDFNQLVLMRSLEIKPYKYDIPFQSYIIIQSSKNVCVLYTAAKIQNNGTFSSKYFVKKILWKGTIEEWENKIKKIYSYVSDSYPLYPIKEAHELLIS